MTLRLAGPARAVLVALLLALGALAAMDIWVPYLAPPLVFFGVVALGVRRLNAVGWGLLMLLVSAGALAARDDPALFARAVQSAVFLTALIAALLCLGRALGRARDIRMTAELVAGQPQGRRYPAITLGSHLLSVILNFGAVALISACLAPQRDTLARQGALVPLSLAMLRGFAAMPMWSPLAMSILITMSLIPEVEYWRILPVCVSAAALYLAMGIVLDRRTGPGVPPSAHRLAPEERWMLLRVLGRTVLLIGSVLLLKQLAGMPMLNAVFTAIIAVLGWTWLRELQRGEGVIGPDLNAVGLGGVNELVILATASFAGPVMTHYLQGMGDALPMAGPLAAAFLTAMVPVAMVGFGMFAMNPILSGTFLIGVLRPIWPEAELHLLALAVILGWGITSAGTPFTANVLIAARTLQVPAMQLALRANRRLTLLSLGAVALGGVAASYAL